MCGNENIGINSDAVPIPLDRLYRLYWRVALVLVPSMIPALYFGGWALRVATASFGLSMAALFPLRRRIPRLSVLIHAGLAYSTAIIELILPASAVITVLPPSEWQPALAIFATIGIYSLAMYGGLPVAAISFAAALVILSSHFLANLPILIALALGAAAGIAVRAAIGELVESRDLLRRHALTDPLTELGNRRAMENEYLRYRATAKRRSVSMFLSLWDLDNLKQINDVEGHVQGDATLLNFAGVLQSVLRQNDAVFRIGGDEFCCLHLGLSDGASIIDRVRRIFPSVSVGFRECANLTLNDALLQVDKLMYDDKRRRHGRNEGDQLTP
ncbi:GGDEF domain-containing protein [Ferrimicrobium acidiphilum]|uniref:GGDEF domain-containing protein n=1 Tax=Ferrimicrobium acidiphilum TaxID=121039 RepID=UPI0023F4197B|nr:GGDEF domain-containing protein [Ferrimicrobium acidiphilum]